jgi:hypothetical protein
MASYKDPAVYRYLVLAISAQPNFLGSRSQITNLFCRETAAIRLLRFEASLYKIRG